MSRISAYPQLLTLIAATMLGLALMLTPLCHGQAAYYGPPHNVIYSNGAGSNGNDAFPELANTSYTDVIVNFLTVDTNCQLQLNSPPNLSYVDMQALHAAGKTVPDLIRQQSVRGLSGVLLQWRR